MMRRTRAKPAAATNSTSIPAGYNDNDDHEQHPPYRRSPKRTIFLVLAYLSSLALKHNYSHRKPRNSKVYGSHARSIWMDENLRFLQLNITRNIVQSREIFYPMVADDYTPANPKYPDPDECEYTDWQKETHMSCNSLHELDLTQTSRDKKKKEPKRLAGGGWRDVWSVPMNEQSWALKTLLYEHDYTERNADRHRRDALILEHFTSSPHIANLYAHCGHSVVVPLAPASLWNTIAPRDYRDKPPRNRLSKLKKVQLAAQACAGVATLHGGQGPATLAHTDITTDQFIFHNGVLQLNDFNRARFMGTTKCPFRISHNPGKYRSPEEYIYKPETEQIDVYSLGNCIYTIWTDYDVFEEADTEEAQEMVKKGERPPVSAQLMNSTDPLDIALKQVMQATMAQEPTLRMSALEAQMKLEAVIRRYNATWKVSDAII